MTKPKCSGTTLKGTPCSKYALGDLEGFGYVAECIAHAPGEVRESKGFGGAQDGSGRPKTPRVVDVIRAKLEENADVVLLPLFAALGADGAVIANIKGGGQRIEMVPDFDVRLKAVKEILDRSYGRPTQQTELSGELVTRDRMDLSKLTDAELASIAPVLAKLG